MQAFDFDSYTLRNFYDEDLEIIPEIVDSATAHFLMERFWEPMNLEIRILPELRNRRKMTITMGSNDAMSIDENKYLKPCVCERQRVEELQKIRLRRAFDEVRRRWREVHPGILNPQQTISPYQYDRPMHLYMPDNDDSMSTARPIATATRGGRASFSHQSIQEHVKAMRSNSSRSRRSRKYVTGRT